MLYIFAMAYPTIFLCFASREPDCVPWHERKREPYRCACAAQVEYIRVLHFKFFFISYFLFIYYMLQLVFFLGFCERVQQFV